MELLQTENGCKWHYDYIKDMYNKAKHKYKKYFCMNCLLDLFVFIQTLNLNLKEI